MIEYRGEAIRKLSMDARMTICQHVDRGGRPRRHDRSPDEVTFEYLKGRPHAPEGELWDMAVEYWKTLKTDDDAVFDKEVTLNAADLQPYVTWGTNPGQGAPIYRHGAGAGSRSLTETARNSGPPPRWLNMGLEPGTRRSRTSRSWDTVFIGSCSTNAAVEEPASTSAAIMKGHHEGRVDSPRC